MLRGLALTAMAALASAGALAEDKKPPEPKFTEPAAQFMYRPFVPGREPKTPGKAAGTSRRELPRQERDKPLKINIPEKGGTTLPAEPRGRRLLIVDLDGDGKYKGKAENLSLNGKTGYFGPTTAIIKWPDGTRMYYGFVVYPRPQGVNDGRYCVERYGLMAGKLKGTGVQIIDDDSNGLYNDYGKDVILIGRKPPVLLGKMIILGGELYHMKVSPAGHRVNLAKYEGKTGKIDLTSGYTPPRGATLAVAAVGTGTTNFDVLGDAKTPEVSIPEGKYELTSGTLRKFNYQVAMVKGNMKPMEVKAGVPAAKVKWGAPFKMDFKLDSKILGISIDECGLYGAGGEMYLTPLEPVPVVTVYRGTVAVHRGKMERARDGTLRPYHFDPRRSGKYAVEVIQRSPLFGTVTSGRREVEFKGFGR